MLKNFKMRTPLKEKKGLFLFAFLQLDQFYYFLSVCRYCSDNN